jgi:hypothetical protein
LNIYVQKPCEAIQLKKENIKNITNFFPEEKFVFFGIDIINGVDQKIFDDDLTHFKRVGGFYYHNKEVKTIYENEWIIKRKDVFEIVNDEYFQNNFVQVPFVHTNDIEIKKEEEKDVNT